MTDLLFGTDSDLKLVCSRWSALHSPTCPEWCTESQFPVCAGSASRDNMCYCCTWWSSASSSPQIWFFRAVALLDCPTPLIINPWSIPQQVNCACQDVSFHIWCYSFCSSYISLLRLSSGWKAVITFWMFCFCLGHRARTCHALDKEFKFGEGTHFLDPAIVDYLTTEDLLRKWCYPKPPTALIIPS